MIQDLRFIQKAKQYVKYKMDKLFKERKIKLKFVLAPKEGMTGKVPQVITECQL